MGVNINQLTKGGGVSRTIIALIVFYDHLQMKNNTSWFSRNMFIDILCQLNKDKNKNRQIVINFPYKIDNEISNIYLAEIMYKSLRNIITL